MFLLKFDFTGRSREQSEGPKGVSGYFLDFSEKQVVCVKEETFAYYLLIRYN